MKMWSNIRNKLENEFLAESLQGRITYFVTTYSKCPDHEGRAAIRLDGVEIFKSSYYEKMKEHSNQFHRLYDNGEGTFGECWMRAFSEAERNGEFDQNTFYRAFEEFNSQGIEESLRSDTLLVRVFAVLDRRCGKRRLLDMLNRINDDESPVFQTFLQIRADAEKLFYKEKNVK